MSDSTAPHMPRNGAEEFDRRIRSIGQTPSDAMAELARLVGQQDPFRPGAGGSAYPAMVADDAQPHLDAADEPGMPVEPAVVHAPLPEPQAWERAVPRFPSISPRAHRPIEQTPDLWALGAGDERDDGSEAPFLSAAREIVPAESSGAGRTLIVLAAVIALTGGGLAASFLAKPSASIAIASETPTILAATGPSKVQPEAPAAGEDAPSEPSKLLDKNKNDGTAEARVVNTVEQPVDLAQAVKPAAPEVADAPAAPPSPFPEPRKVKTILVRPDGSIITDSVPTSPARMPVSAANQQASLAFDARTALPPRPSDQPPAAAPPPVPEPAAAEAAQPAATSSVKPPLGKVTARATPAKPAASTAAEGSAAAQARSSVATPKIKPAAHLAAKPKPADATASVMVADATPTADTPVAAEAAPATTPVGGGFAIQLGAALSEADGQAAASKLGQRYADDFGGAKPSVHKAQAGGKTVYRIRVGNLSQDGAKALCAKVQAGGGGCFVARN